MAGFFEVLATQSFTATSSITFTHGLNRLQVAVVLRVGGLARNDLIESITPDILDPRNKLAVVLTSAQTGSIALMDTDLTFASIPTPEEAAALSDSVTGGTITPGLHAASHQDGGSDEVGTATPTANAIPKADGTGSLDAWVTAGTPVYVDYYDVGTTDVGTSATTMGLDTSRQSDALFVLSSDQVTVQSGGAGDYAIRYEVTFNESDATNREAECWLEINGTEVPGTRSTFSHWSEHGLNTDNCAGRSAILTLAVSDVVRIRGQVTTGTANYTTNAGGVSLQIMSIGSTGPAGPTGATGSGSNIIVQDDGSTVSGGPHSTLNFINATIADAGAGVVDISNIKQCLVCCPFGGDNMNTGEFSIANGKANDADLNSGPRTRQPIISGGTLIRLAYQTQQANSSSVMKVHINGSVQATVPLTNINANLGGVETISVSVSAGDYVELEYDAGTAPRDSTWCFLLEVS